MDVVEIVFPVIFQYVFSFSFGFQKVASIWNQSETRLKPVWNQFETLESSIWRAIHPFGTFEFPDQMVDKASKRVFETSLKQIEQFYNVASMDGCFPSGAF